MFKNCDPCTLVLGNSIGKFQWSRKIHGPYIRHGLDEIWGVAKRSKLFFHYGCGTTPGVQPRTCAETIGINCYSPREADDFTQTLDKYEIKAWISPKNELDLLISINEFSKTDQCLRVFLGGFLWFWYGSNAREETNWILIIIFKLKKKSARILETHFEKVSNWLFSSHNEWSSVMFEPYGSI